MRVPDCYRSWRPPPDWNVLEIDGMLETRSYEIECDWYRLRYDSIVNGDHRLITFPPITAPKLGKKIRAFRAKALELFREKEAQ